MHLPRDHIQPLCPVFVHISLCFAVTYRKFIIYFFSSLINRPPLPYCRRPCYIYFLRFLFSPFGSTEHRLLLSGLISRTWSNSVGFFLSTDSHIVSFSYISSSPLYLLSYTICFSCFSVLIPRSSATFLPESPSFPYCRSSHYSNFLHFLLHIFPSSLFSLPRHWFLLLSCPYTP